MPQANQSTVAQRIDLQGESSSFDTDPAAENPFQNAGEAVRLALAYGKHAVRTAGMDDREVKASTQSASTQSASTQSASTGRKQNDDHISQIVTFPQLRARREPAVTLHALQEWEGYVLNIGVMDFVARLIDLTAGSSQEEEEAVIPLTEISDDDVVRIREGSIFRWVIGYERSPAGTKKRVSQIVFRDLPAMTKSDLQNGRVWADQISDSLEL